MENSIIKMPCVNAHEFLHGKTRIFSASVGSRQVMAINNFILFLSFITSPICLKISACIRMHSNGVTDGTEDWETAEAGG